VELLGEIPLPSEERIQLGRAIGALLQSQRRSRALDALRHEYPCAFAVFLTAQGIYGYDGRGGYWPGVGATIGKPLGTNWTGELGRLFENIIDDLEMPFFPDLGRRYVGLILAHGGIPDYCLSDFFNNMLQPAVTRVYYADMSAAELIEEWLWHASGRYFTDKPVLRFLEFGGEVAQDFVARCLEMAWEYLDAGIVPAAEELGLPERVVAAYRRWIVEQSAEATQREEAERWRLRRPQLLVDPWGEGVLLELPPQQVPATQVYADIAWQVKADEEEAYSPLQVRVRRTGFDRKTEVESLSLSQPAASYQVSLQVDGEMRRTWRYRGVSEEHPLLVFDPERFTILSWQHSLPARRLGLLYPAELDLQIEGQAELVEKLPRLPWGWSGFRAQTWDLSQATGLVLLKDDEAILTVPLRPDEEAQRPRLVGGQILAPEAPGVRVPVYVGAPPSIRIPLVGRGNLEEELARWRLTVRNKWTAIPEIYSKETLADLRSELIIGEQHVELPLGLPSLLGEAPFGNFSVRLRGPLGRDAEFTLRIIPHLVICGEDTLYLPDPVEGPRPAMLLAETGPDDRVEWQGESEECRVRLAEQHRGGREYEIEIGSGTTEVELTVARPLPSGEDTRVPVPVSIHRLRWALAEEAVSGRKAWTGGTIRRPVEALMQSQSPYLLVTLPLPETQQATVGLRLLDVDGTELQVVDRASLSKGKRLCRFDLSAFLDTIRASRSPVLRLALDVEGLPQRDGPLRFAALSLTRSLIVEDVGLETRSTDGHTVLDLTWREATPLRNRHVRLWSLWQPWEPVVERTIPDETEGAASFTFDSGAFLHQGKYRVEFVVVDSWAPPVAPERPSRGTQGTADIELTPASRRLELLDDQLQEEEASFELLLERAFVYTDVGDLEKARADWQWCFDHLDDGTVPQILALVDLLRSADDTASLTGLQLKMFSPGRIERLLQDKKAGKVSPDDFRRYLNNLPRSSLLSVPTCQQLLSVEDDTVRLHAVQQLIRRQDPQGVSAVVEWVDAATLSDADAVGLLNVNAEFGADCLEEQLGNPTALRLLETLALEMEDRTPVVRPGTWVYTDAGWGRIERMEDPDGQPVEQFITGERDYRLYVTLRPALDAMPIVVDLAKKVIRFTEADCIFTCTKCYGFSTQAPGLILNRHDPVAHEGMGPSYRPERGTRRSLRKLKYSSRPPDHAGLGCGIQRSIEK